MTYNIPTDLDDFVHTAQQLADIGRQTANNYFRKSLDVDHKSDRSPVTIADRQTEEAMRALIIDRHPDHGIVGEEFGARKAKSDWCWILDPIDGTKSFVCGKPTFGSLVSLVYKETPVIGVIEMPALGERWLGVHDRPTTHEGSPCRATAVARLDDAAMLSTTPDMFDDKEWQVFESISLAARVRAFGTDCYGYGLLASGYCDAVMESDLKPYDIMALVPVIEGAGAVISDWHGRPLSATSNGQVLACATAELRDDIVARIAAGN
ncbi:MAG: histidinol phosphate phosphatase [marine bacterium B5-7]|nr:MAG: histidinol phosphate phosphatase [marine bacterium B5-7]